MYKHADKAQIQSAYENAKKVYANYGVDADKAVAAIDAIPVSLHCWQADDVQGLEGKGALTGGILATGNFPGQATNGDEIRAFADKAFGLVPGKHKFNIHAFYAETGGKKVDRDQIDTEHFRKWIDWAKKGNIGLDFNPTYFSHPKSGDGTLTHADKTIRDFWIRHGQATRRIAADMSRELGSPVVNNIWIPDGMKDLPADRLSPRLRLRDSLDQVLSQSFPAGKGGTADNDASGLIDAVESKLFGIGSEAYVAGSHEFYLSYVAQRAAAVNPLYVTLDTGHFHPTENVSDKISSLLAFFPGVLLHISRGIRWDSDHVSILSDETQAMATEAVRSGKIDRVCFALDYFDASINRIAAWVIGYRALRKALLAALLEPIALLRKLESSGDYTARLALLEEAKTLPSAAVWDYYCQSKGVPVGMEWLNGIK